MKLCRTCSTEKTLFEFGVRNASQDGLSPKCKSCSSAYDKLRAGNSNRVEARAAYSKTDAYKESHKKANKKYVENNKDKLRDIHKGYRERNPKKLMCHGIVGYAIKCKTLIKQHCEVCNDDMSQGHHDDYNEPLVVRWLCSKHHKQWHSENGEGLNAS